MKKLLTILVLALALCLVCSAALADGYAGKFDWYDAYDNATYGNDTDSNGIDCWTLNQYKLKAGTITFSPSLKSIQENTTDCEAVVLVTVTGTLLEENGTDVTAENRKIDVSIGVYGYHQWEPDYESEKTVAATCGVKGNTHVVCERCGKEEDWEEPALVHSYKKVDTSTCKAAGKITYVCQYCGELLKDADGKVVEEKGTKLTTHSYAVSITAPTCDPKDETAVLDGKVKVVCSVCGDVIKDWAATNKIEGTDQTANAAVTAKLGSASTPDADGVGAVTVAQYETYKKMKAGTYDVHSWGEWTAPVPATCEHPSQRTHRCKNCGKTEAAPVSADAKALDPIWGLAPGYDCSNVWDGDTVDLVCKICGGKVASHNETANAAFIDATDPLKGLKIENTALNFVAYLYHGKVRVERVHYEWNSGTRYADTLDQVWDDSFCSDTTAEKITDKVCDDCGYGVSIHESMTDVHYYGDWKHDNTAGVDKWTRLCKICDHAETTTTKPIVNPCKPAEHKWVVAADNTTEIKCGTTKNVKQICSVCGQKQTADWKREDDWKVVGTVKEPTCTETGLSIAVCNYDNCSNVDYPEIPATGHTPVAVKEVPATCKEAGTKAGFKCSVCGKFLDADKADANIIEALEVIPVDETAHAWAKEEVVKAATCKEAGVALKTCSVCGKVEKVEIEKLAHTWDEGKITKEATKEAKGEKTYTCTACGETKTEEVEYVVTAAPKYSVTGLTYDGQTLKGKLAHDEDTLEAETLNVRVTFFMTGNYYMATIGEVAADGSFSVDGVGPIEYISVVATGSSSVNPDDVVALGSGEITVK